MAAAHGAHLRVQLMHHLRFASAPSAHRKRDGREPLRADRLRDGLDRFAALQGAGTQSHHAQKVAATVTLLGVERRLANRQVGVFARLPLSCSTLVVRTANLGKRAVGWKCGRVGDEPRRRHATRQLAGLLVKRGHVPRWHRLAICLAHLPHVTRDATRCAIRRRRGRLPQLTQLGASHRSVGCAMRRKLRTKQIRGRLGGIRLVEARRNVLLGAHALGLLAKLLDLAGGASLLAIQVILALRRTVLVIPKCAVARAPLHAHVR